MEQFVTLPERQAQLRLPDGRTLAWSEWGPRDGLPVVFCPGAGTSGSLGFGADVLPGLKIRLMAIDRPGLGRSDPHPGKTLDTWAEDVRVWAAANRLQRLGAVGFSQGAPFAFVLGSYGITTAVAIVSGQDEFTHPRIRPLLAPEVAGMLTAIEHDATAFEQAFAAAVTAEGLWQLIVEMSGERDRGLYTSEPFATLFQQALGEGFRQGSQGYVRDLVNTMGPWPIVLEQIRTPVGLWYGALDTSVVHSPDFGTTLAARLTDTHHTIDGTEGGSLLWTRAGDVLAWLQARV